MIESEIENETEVDTGVRQRVKLTPSTALNIALFRKACVALESPGVSAGDLTLVGLL